MTQTRNLALTALFLVVVACGKEGNDSKDCSHLEVPCTEQYGADALCMEFANGNMGCGFPEGHQCELRDEDVHYAPCAGDAPACVWTMGESVSCRTDFPEPTCEPDTFAPHCVGDMFVYRCNQAHGANQPLAADCAGLGGTCDPTGCVIAAGGACNGDAEFRPRDIPGRAFCDVGLTCSFVADGPVVGTCQDLRQE